MTLEDVLPAGRERIVVYVGPLLVLGLWPVVTAVLGVVRALTPLGWRLPEWAVLVSLVVVTLVSLAVANGLERLAVLDEDGGPA